MTLIKPAIRKTQYGLINTEHRLGRVYITHRKPEHYFIQFQGFGISESEIREMDLAFVKWIIFIYHKDNGEQIAYYVNINKLKECRQFKNGNDLQRIVPKHLYEKEKP